ncbi:phosphodiester glycosidase family protein [Acaryochloris sp. IP29b_bin.148]|uniref:phosphodiester glycosidase family protein n=1 Tax=Acaryochloris sp. IP29b_bin.148 TaxID=2969218 RepID=UPI0026290DFF|nr:phosphodiester glycosidase family protein [Acaryochloris sp. IP29b_bin.148]
MRRLKLLGWAAISVSLLAPLFCYGKSQWQRPFQTPQTKQLFAGITYRRQVFHHPRPYIAHIAQIDLTHPGIRVMTTPGQLADDQNEFHADQTSSFLTKHQLQLAVNAGYFYRFYENTPWDFAPRTGDRVNVLGQSVAGGQEYSPSQAQWPVLCFDVNQRAQIIEGGQCPPNTLNAVAGSHILDPHKPLQLEKDKPYARSVAALDQAGQTLWLILVDGKQPTYSEGATLAEIEQLVQQLGAEVALNLDGGGSATLVASTVSGASLLNAPIHGKWPMKERPVATHLGIYAHAVE